MVALGVSLGAAGCGGSATDDGRTDVVAAFYPLAYAAGQIGGDRVSVSNLTPPGAEPHDLELTARDVKLVRDADLVLYLGHGFQPGLEDAVAEREGPSLDLLDGQALGSYSDEDGEETADPHVWLDPARYAKIARATAAGLGRPGAADGFVARLATLDREFRRGLGTCARRQIVTSHAAFGYLARRYGLEQVALMGLSPEAEPSPRDVERLVREVERSGATTVFSESLVSPKLAETVAREAGAATAVLNPVEGLTEKQAARGENYFSVMRDNLAALRQALGCP